MQVETYLDMQHPQWQFIPTIALEVTGLQVQYNVGLQKKVRDLELRSVIYFYLLFVHTSGLSGL